MGLFDTVARRIENTSPARLAKQVIHKHTAKLPYNVGGIVNGAVNGAIRNATDAVRSSLSSQFGSFLGLFGTTPPPLNMLVPDLGSMFGSGPGGSLGSGAGSKVIGGVTLEKAKEIFNEVANTDHARKNLFYISVDDISPSGDWLGEGNANFNLFATEVSYTPVTIQGDAVSVGSAQFDAAKGSERVEVRVTTLDDDKGTIKRWFNAKAAAFAHPDGTFGLPIDYLLHITILHSFIAEDAPGAGSGLKNKYLVRAGSIEHSLSRREDGLEEIQMTFVQHDTFSVVK